MLLFDDTKALEKPFGTLEKALEEFKHDIIKWYLVLTIAQTALIIAAIFFFK
jgi:hypothetical protein